MWLLEPNGRSMMGDNQLFRPQTYSRNRPTTTRRNDRRRSFRPVSNDEYFAPNLRIHFKLVWVTGAAGAQLTRPPSRDAGVSNIWINGSPFHLEPDDVIYNLDGLPIRAAVDVMNHHGRTVVSFVDCRTGRPFAGVMALPGYTPLPDDVPKEIYADNLGMHYQLLALGDGSFGARLSRTALSDTPAGTIGLERGDMIVRLDGQPIRGPRDVLSHIAGTSVEFVNIRTGKVQIDYVELPVSAVKQERSEEREAAAPN
jgi:hypothetical protein